MTNSRRAQGAGSVYLRKDGRYAAAGMYEGKRITKYGKTKKEAWDNLQTALDDLKAGRVVLGPKQTVKQYLEYWLENVHRHEIELTTLSDYRGILRSQLIPAFGHLQLAQLTREKIQAFVNEKLQSGLSAGWVKQIYIVLSAALSYAVLNEMLARNPCSLVRLPPVKKVKHRVLSKEQAARLVDAAKGRRLWFMLLLALTTGARVGELLALHWEDIDVNNLRVHIHRNVASVKGMGLIEKGPKSISGVRWLVLPQAVIDAFPEQRAYVEALSLRAKRWDDCGLVFPNRHGGYIRNKQVLKELRDILSEIGLPSLKFHELRHSVATLLLAAGIDPKTVSKTLGHSRVAFTLDEYGEVTPDMEEAVAGVLGQIFE
jgi:integrase